MKRHPNLSIRTPERVSKARCGVSEENIRAWFTNLRTNLEKMNALDVLNDPKRIFNMDESCIQLSPSTGKVIAMTGWKNIYEVAPGPEKSNLTFLGSFSAHGDIVAPMIIYPYYRVPKDIANAVPQSFTIGTSESGWMKAETFFEFIQNAFINYLVREKVQRPVILFVDGHKTHMSLQVSTLCEDNNIILYLLPPNTTHILQPADVGPFKPLKAYWRQTVVDFQRENPNCVVRRKNIAPLLEKVLQRITRDSITNGFRACGIYPFNPNAVDYSKCLDVLHTEEDGNDPDTVDPEETQHNYEEALKVLKHELKGRDPSLISSSDWLEMYNNIESRGTVTLDSSIIELDEENALILNADDLRAQEPIAENISGTVLNID